MQALGTLALVVLTLASGAGDATSGLSQTVSEAAPADDGSSAPTRFALSSLRPGCSIAADFIGDPQLSVWVDCTGRKRTVSGLSDLEGFVAIKNAAEALEYVRLFTEGGRWMLTGIGDYAEVRWGSKPNVGRFVVTKELFAKCCRDPKVTTSTSEGPAAFTVTRVVVDRKYRVYLLTERVSSVGHVEVGRRQRLETGGRALGFWAFHNR